VAEVSAVRIAESVVRHLDAEVVDLVSQAVDLLLQASAFFGDEGLHRHEGSCVVGVYAGLAGLLLRRRTFFAIGSRCLLCRHSHRRVCFGLPLYRHR
jgi:hypothetical protein